jgi:hypothetical protein
MNQRTSAPNVDIVVFPDPREARIKGGVVSPQ